MNDDLPMLALIFAQETASIGPVAEISRDEISRDGESSNTVNLGHLFARLAAGRAAAPAVTTSTGQWNYGQLLAAARLVAARLALLPGFTAGERVIVLLPNSAEYAAAFYGVLLAGGVVVPLPVKVEAGVLAEITNSTDPRCLLTSSQVLQSRDDLHRLGLETLDLSAARPLTDPERTTDVAGKAAIGDQQPCREKSRAAQRDCVWPASSQENELAAIFFTAGSTGTPKGVMLSHQNLISNALAIQEYLQIDEQERPLCVLPFHHAFGNSVLQSHLLAGAELVLGGLTAFPETFIKALADYNCTSLSGVPELFRLLLGRSSLGQTRLPSLRYLAVAGGELPRQLALDAACRIAPAELFVMYGQTEATARLAYVPPRNLALAPVGCIGRPVPGVALEVVDEQGMALPAGAVGELRARGPNVMMGYWQDLAATAERIREGWLYTGDLAAIDAQGWIVHHGRRNALVKIAGYRVHPSDLEEFAVRRLSAGEAVAVAFDAPGVGTRLALFVKPISAGAGPIVSEMIARCRSELPRHLVPYFVQIVDEMPLNHALKIDRPLLERRAAEEPARGRTAA